jgi:ATP-dependent DNA helicase RecG
MRPDLLNPLFGDVTRLRGVGEAVLRQLARLDIEKPLDLLLHMPAARLRRVWQEDLSAARSGDTVVLPIMVVEHDAPRSGKGPLRVQCLDAVGEALTLVFFSNPGDYIGKQLPRSSARVISGTLEQYQGRFQIVHPDYILPASRVSEVPLDEPIYPLTEGMGNKRLSALIAQVLERAPELPEWIDTHLMEKQRWPSWQAAIMAVHKSGAAEARARLAYDELFANQLALAMVRARVRRDKGRAFAGAALRALPIKLPFALTKAQSVAVDEIVTDLASDAPMLRLLQGDVGSGKTVVALLACARIASFGHL